MSSFLNTSHETLTVTPLPAYITKAQVLALLHDSERMITLNPLVTAYHLQPASAAIAFFKGEPAENQPQGEVEEVPIYSVTDDLAGGGKEAEAEGGSWRGGWAKRFIPDSITYNSSMQNRDDGLVSITHAPMGVNSVTTWLVKDSETDDSGKPGLVLEERGKVTSNRMLMGFIKTTLQASHEKLVQDFVVELEKGIAKEKETASANASAGA
ncbi:hypothetical protein PVAG01_05124 [Phlyctema vagabunda]|uniref:DUF7053 domain-containing protein n=1 Tax=Phlyctema vagabunda TaxID=108571 RepID=A0ABR4PJ68_9HELO